MTDDQKHLQDAFFLYQQGRLVEAASNYEQLIKRNPNNHDALHYFGILKASCGQFEEARQLMERSLATRVVNLSYLENYVSILFKIGDYQQAIKVCVEKIKENRKTETLQYVLAVSLHKLGRLKEANDEFGSLLLSYPNHLAGNNEKASTLAELRRYEEALSFVDRALRIDSGYAEAFLNRGNILAKLIKYDESLVAYKKALSLKANIFEAYIGCASVYRALKRFEEAFAAYDKALVLRPDLTEAWLGRGRAFAALKRFDEAHLAYDKALALDPDMAEAWLDRGDAFAEMKRYDEAFVAYEKAITLKPDLAGVWLSRGNVFTELRRFDEAFAVYDKALALEPDLAAAWLGRGNAFTELKRSDEALAAYDRALALAPDLAEAWLGRGNAFTELKSSDEALVAYDRALALDPDLTEAFIGRGIVLSDLKRYDEACAAFDQAIRLERTAADAYWNKSLVKLCLGNFEEGWDLYEWRSQIKENALFDSPFKSLNLSVRKNRSALINKKVTILSEQGIGDEIMFASILNDLAKDAETVFYEVDPRLVRLFASAFPSVNIVPRDSSDYFTKQVFDVVLQAGSLGYAYRRAADVFQRAPYLSADPTLIDKWKAKLANKAGSRTKIGLSWRGGTDKTRRSERTIELKQLYPMIQRDDCYFVSLQYGNVSDEILEFNQESSNNSIYCLLDDFNNFDDFAALITALDLVISVQNTTIHMCGALGKTCWGMIPWRPEWRYGNNPRDMIWYSSIALYRQQTAGDWDAVISSINSDLANYCRLNQ